MSVLDEIVANTRAEVARRKSAVPRAMLERHCDAAPAPRDFEGALRPSPGAVRLIAEVKKASPSRGVLSSGLDPVALATTYATHGAHAISVLTDEKYFRGSLDDLRRVRAAVDVPLLRKDFTIDDYQLWESRAAGADAVLLIVSILEPARLAELLAAAKGLGLAALVECHTARGREPHRRDQQPRSRHLRDPHHDDARAPPADPARSHCRQRKRFLHRRRRPPRGLRRRPRSPRRRRPRPRPGRARENPGANSGGLLMRTTTPAVRADRAPRPQARTTAQAVRGDGAPRRQARTAAQGVPSAPSQREPGGKWGGRLAPPIQQ